jgi:hypothetical protein
MVDCGSWDCHIPFTAVFVEQEHGFFDDLRCGAPGSPFFAIQNDLGFEGDHCRNLFPAFLTLFFPPSFLPQPVRYTPLLQCRHWASTFDYAFGFG